MGRFELLKNVGWYKPPTGLFINVGCGKVLIWFRTQFGKYGRRGNLMISALDSGLRGLGSSPGRAIVLWSWPRQLTLTMPLHPGVKMSTGELPWKGWGVGGNLAMILILSTRESPVSDVGWNTGGRVNLAMNWYPMRGWVAILLVASWIWKPG